VGVRVRHVGAHADPVILVFITCQKFFVQGLTAGSVKG
jgi:ABC-type maltose transport system permease subunit